MMGKEAGPYSDPLTNKKQGRKGEGGKIRRKKRKIFDRKRAL